MRWFQPINSKTTLLFSGCLGVVLGFLMTKVLISYRDKNEEIISLGDTEADGNTAEINPGNSRSPSRILCLVISALEDRKAETVNNTWGKRCDKLIFLTSRRADDLATVLLPEDVEDKRETLWTKVKHGFIHAYFSYYDFDWFFKADDDTYVVMENLKAFLSGFDTSTPMFFGCRLKSTMTTSFFMSGGSGYVLSREALRLFVEVALKQRDCSDNKFMAEDVSMGRCMENVNVTFMDTRDYFGRHRFLPVSPYNLGHLQPKRSHDAWYNTMSHYLLHDGPECCAESAITFHYILSPYMDLMEFFLHDLSPHQH